MIPSLPLPARAAIAVAAVLAFSSPVRAVIYGGINFPDGAVSFADAVVSYNPTFGGGLAPDVAYQIPNSALGVPNYPAANSYVSLGAGGRIVLQFTDNYLTGSNSAAHDLHIFEVGPDVEDTDVDISKDGVQWFSVGKVFGATSSIDIDAYGFSSTDFFSFVRLTDLRYEGNQSGSTVGADIDAVGAITTVSRGNVPDSGSSLVLALASVLCLATFRRRAGH